MDRYLSSHSSNTDYTPTLMLCRDTTLFHNSKRGDVIQFEIPPVSMIDEREIKLSQQQNIGVNTYYDLRTITLLKLSPYSNLFPVPTILTSSLFPDLSPNLGISVPYSPNLGISVPYSPNLGISVPYSLQWISYVILYKCICNTRNQFEIILTIVFKYYNSNAGLYSSITRCVTEVKNCCK